MKQSYPRWAENRVIRFNQWRIVVAHVYAWSFVPSESGRGHQDDWTCVYLGSESSSPIQARGMEAYDLHYQLSTAFGIVV